MQVHRNLAENTGGFLACRLFNISKRCEKVLRQAPSRRVWVGMPLQTKGPPLLLSPSTVPASGEMARGLASPERETREREEERLTGEVEQTSSREPGVSSTRSCQQLPPSFNACAPANLSARNLEPNFPSLGLIRPNLQPIYHILHQKCVSWEEWAEFGLKGGNRV